MNMINKLCSYISVLQCSRTCETGHQKRVVCCVEGDEVVPDDRCNENTRPVSERNCNGHIRCFRK